MPIVNGYKYCAKRDTAYNFLTIQKPTNNTLSDGNVSYSCSDDKMSKMCGDDTNKFTDVFCIPSTSECPMRSIKFDVDTSEIILSSDAEHGTPLIDLKLSEGGPPCLHETGNYNAQLDPPKQSFELYKASYSSGCPEVTINNVTLSESTLY